MDMDRTREKANVFVKLLGRHKQAVIASFVIASAVALAWLMVVSRKPPQRVEIEVPAPLVEVERLSVRDIPMVVSSYGTVTPKVEVEIAPQVAGNVVWVNASFRAGGIISANQPIIKIDPRDYELAVRQAEALVAEADVVLDIEKAEAAVAKKEWQQLNPNTEPDSPLVLREPQIRRAEAQLESAKARLETAQLNLERTVVSLPIDVRVINEQVDLGQFVAVGRSVGSAYGIEAVEIEVPLEDDELAWFDIPRQSGAVNADHDSAEATIAHVVANIAGRRHVWIGYVKRTTGEVDRNSRLVSVVVEVTNPSDPAGETPPLVPGMFVKVQIQGRTLKNAVAVPRDAVRQSNEVWLVNDGKLRIRPLDIVRADRNFAYAVSGVEHGDMIVLSSLDAASDGMNVRTQVRADTEQQNINADANRLDVQGADE